MKESFVSFIACKVEYALFIDTHTYIPTQQAASLEIAEDKQNNLAKMCTL